MAVETQLQSQPVGISQSSEAEVSFSEILPDDLDAIFADGEKDFSGIYSEYTLRAYYEFDNNILMAPVAGATPTAEFIKVASATGSWRVEWLAVKDGARPELPAVFDDPNMVHLGSSIDVDNVDATAEGVMRYTVGGEYRFGYVDANQANVKAPVPPWIDCEAVCSDLTIQTGDFNGNILNCCNEPSTAATEVVGDSGHSGGGANAV